MKHSTETFDPRRYWETRLSSNPNLRGTGHRSFSVEYNDVLYRIASGRLCAAMREVGIDLVGSRILDVGAGFGYFVQRYIHWGASHVTGVDVTEVSVQSLQRAFPGHQFLRADVTEPDLPLGGDFDVVSAISVLYHVLDDRRFGQAMRNMCARVKPGGYLIAVDLFNRAPVLTARHTRLRTWAYYRPVLDQYGFRVCDVRPLYYVMGRGMIPVLGPRLLSQPAMLRLLESIERGLERGRVRSNLGGIKLMIARRCT
jgi:SAM-dependent methyltransferase